jgi:hypothetical protein
MHEYAQWAIFFILVLNSAFIGLIAAALWMLQSRLSRVQEQVQPLLARADELAGKVDGLLAKVDQRVTVALDSADHLVRDVSQKVETTTAIAEETISQPLIGAASLMAGISRGLSAYKEMNEKGDGQDNG